MIMDVNSNNWSLISKHCSYDANSIQQLENKNLGKYIGHFSETLQKSIVDYVDHVIHIRNLQIWAH